MTPLRFSPARGLCAAMAFCVISVLALSAAQVVWVGNFSTSPIDGANYAGGVAPKSNTDGISFGSADSAGGGLTLPTGGTFLFTNAGCALTFTAGASTYRISGTSNILPGTGSIVNNSGVRQVIDLNVKRNTSNNLTIGANGGIVTINGTYDLGSTVTSPFLSFNNFTFGATHGGILELLGGLINTGDNSSATALTLPTLSSPAFGMVVIGGNNSAVTGTMTLGARTRP